jgi:hypothetical protein
MPKHISKVKNHIGVKKIRENSLMSTHLCMAPIRYVHIEDLYKEANSFRM